jgi:hypothetical protein
VQEKSERRRSASAREERAQEKSERKRRAVVGAPSFSNATKTPAQLDLNVQIRIGVHTGRSVAGVVGSKDPRFHLFGETVNCAEKIESTGLSGHVHCSEATRQSVLKSSNSLIPDKRFSEMFKFDLRTAKKVDEEFEAVTKTDDVLKQISDRKESINKAANAVGKSYFVSLTRPLAGFAFDKLQLRQLASKNQEGEARDLMKSSRRSGKKNKTKISKRNKSFNKPNGRSKGETRDSGADSASS